MLSVRAYMCLHVHVIKSLCLNSRKDELISRKNLSSETLECVMINGVWLRPNQESRRYRTVIKNFEKDFSEHAIIEIDPETDSEEYQKTPLDRALCEDREIN